MQNHPCPACSSPSWNFLEKVIIYQLPEKNRKGTQDAGLGGWQGWERTGFPTSGSFNTELALLKNFLEHVFNEISFPSRCRKALGSPALLRVTGKLLFSSVRGDRTRLYLHKRQGPQGSGPRPQPEPASALDKPPGLCRRWQLGDNNPGGARLLATRGPSAAFTHLSETYTVSLLKGPTKTSQLKECLGAVSTITCAPGSQHRVPPTLL